LIGEPNSINNVRWTYYAGFSPAGLTNLTTNAIGTNMSFTNSHQGTYFSESKAFFNRATNGFTDNPAPTNPICTTIPLLGGQTSPPVGWVYLTQRMRQKNSTNTVDVTSPVARVAWFIEDLSGKIDAEQMGGLSFSRLTGTNPEEICLTSMTGTNGSQILPSLTTFTNVTNRKLFFTPGLLAKSSISGLTNSDDLRYFATGLREFRPINNRRDNGMLDWIPSGIPIAIQGTSTNSYANGGSSKLSLNQLINLTAPSNVASIVAVINNNLPNFKNRSGGMNGNTYLLNIAANIVDYVDTDPNPTTNGSTVGYDNYPLPVVFSDRIAWNLNAANPSNSTIQVTTYVQFWNCSTLTSPAVTYTLQNNFQDKYLKSNGAISPVRIFSSSLSNQLSVPALGPNQIIILATTNTTNVGANASYPGGLWITNTLGINNSSPTGFATNTDLFELKLGSTIISQHKGPYTRIGQKIINGSWDFEGTVLTMSRPNGIAPIGDPRMLRFFTNSSVDPLDYRSSQSGNLKWGGYANFSDKPSAANIWNGHPDNWPDGRKSTSASLTGTSQTSGAGGSIPVAVGTPITLPGTAPAILTTNGSFLTIFELGNIFDPMQWKPPATFTRNSLYAGCSIDATWTNNGAELYGGGTTLRIGRPEHQRFAFTNFAANSSPWIPNMGGSAAALLDLFCVSNGNTGGGPFRTGGKINLNTAPAPVLRALAGGILLTNDPAQVPANYTIPTAMAEAFAQGVMRFRSKYPFLTPSHLCFIGTDPSWPNTNNWPTNSVFGNTNTIALSAAPGNTNTTAKMNITEWNDQAAEEWFTKIYNLSTVQSDNYRAYIVAQLVDSNRMPISPVMRKYVQFAGRPNNPNDSTSNNVYGVPMYYWTFTKGLKKFYESPY